jgi:carbonic anhydrase
MTEEVLAELLAGNARHVDSLSADHFAAVEDEQRPAVVSVCCSDSRVSQEGMWAIEEAGYLFTPSTIGNQVWDRHDGARVVDGSVLFPIVETGTRVAVVVGHTGCGAVTAALEAVREHAGGTANATPAGIRKWVDELRPVVESGLADDRVTQSDGTEGAGVVNRLVEYNVDEQVAFLRASADVPDDLRVYGFVYDFQGVYGDDRGRTYLVNADGETDPAALRERVPPERESCVRRLL